MRRAARRGRGAAAGSSQPCPNSRDCCAQNSTLVLTADTRSRDPKEPDGSAATLWGKINPKSFGDRVQFSKPGSEGDAKR